MHGEFRRGHGARRRASARCYVAMQLALVIAMSGCSSSTAPEQHDLAQARQRWALSNVRSYDYTIRRSCECAPDAVRAVTVSVTNGVVTRRVYADTGAPVPEATESFTTVDALFEIIDAALVRHAAVVNASYDQTRGVPLGISIDFDLQMVDDEVSYSVLAFTPR